MKMLLRRAKPALKAIARQALGRLPPPKSRLDGPLALNGGRPVRDVRFRPWAGPLDNTKASWFLSVEPKLRSIYRRGVEGLPQPLALEFADRWAHYCGARYALLLAHGTDALRIALAATLDHDGLDYGGEVIVPNLSFIASATAALDRRFGVALVDVDPGTLLLDPARVEEAIVPGRTRAIMAVHLFGQPADMTALSAIAKKHGLKIIEDAAQAHGADLHSGRTGSFGDAAGFSFQSSKNLSCGEGGALTTNDEQVFERAYAMHNVGRARIGGERWGHLTLGWNCRPAEYQAALLLHRFAGFEAHQVTRARNFDTLREEMADIACLDPVATHAGVRRHGVHMFAMRYRPERCGGLAMADFLKAAQAEGAPIHRSYAATMAGQPAMQKLMTKRPDYFRLLPTPVADRAVNELLYIPQNIFLGSKADMAEIAAAIRKVHRHFAPNDVRRGETVRSVPKGVPAASAAASRSRLRCGVVGAGAMGRVHAAVLAKHPRVSLAGLTDTNPEARVLAREHGCAWFESPAEMFTSGQIDAVVIATPHWRHADLSIAALRSGLHVICEKPVTVTVSDADKVLEAARAAKGIFAVVHQSRFEPAYREAKRLLASGELGPMLRCSMIETTWRSDAYYKTSPWRGTWKGEGGGVLLNQAPHVLDRYVWLCGMPTRVSGMCDAALHQIEVEDSASAVLSHENGAHGYIHVSTNECPAVARTTVACDRGRLVVEGGTLKITRLRRSLKQAIATDTRHFGEIDGDTQELGGGLVGALEPLLDRFYENVALSIAGAATLVCPGTEGRDAVELANGILLSANSGREVTFPLNRASYDSMIAAKLAAVPQPLAS